MAERDQEPTRATLHVRQHGADQARVLEGALANLPRIVAELVDLGPRPYTPSLDAVLVPIDVLDACVGVGLPDSELAAAVELFDGVYAATELRALLGPDSVRWRLELADGAEADEPQVSLDVIDAGSGGLWVLTPAAEPGYADATPASTMAVWLLLARAVSEAASAAA